MASPYKLLRLLEFFLTVRSYFEVIHSIFSKNLPVVRGL